MQDASFHAATIKDMMMSQNRQQANQHEELLKVLKQLAPPPKSQFEESHWSWPTMGGLSSTYSEPSTTMSQVSAEAVIRVT